MCECVCVCDVCVSDVYECVSVSVCVCDVCVKDLYECVCV